MKVLATTTSIISLENVRRVNKNVSEIKHTHYGKPYTIAEYTIRIDYCDGGCEWIQCGEGDNAKDLCDAIFESIYDKLSED